MAATLAASIRGADVIRSAQALKTISAEQLDVDPFAFETVVSVLDDVGFITSIQRRGGKTVSFNENVPYHENLYETLGQAWTDRQPGEREKELVVLVDRLASGPVLEESLPDATGVDRKDVGNVVELAVDADLVQRVTTSSGERVLYSPFLAFEQPDVIAEIVEVHGADRLAEQFALVRDYQGLPIDPEAHPVLMDAIALGLLTGRRLWPLCHPFAAASISTG